MASAKESNKRVLIVEDDKDFAALIESILNEEGYDTTVSFNGEDALDQVRFHPPDLVTLDIQMPRKSGLLFYREMKTDRRLRDIPVIVITGLTPGDRDMETVIRSFLEVDHLPSPESYIEKPFEREWLVQTVKEICPDV